MPCANGTDSCAPGQSVFWFSQGCTPGCPECDGLGQRVPFWDHCNATRAKPFEATLAKQYWTANLNATEGSEHQKHCNFSASRTTKGSKPYGGVRVA